MCAKVRVSAHNYQVDPQTRPSNIGPPFTGHFRVIADTPRGLQPFQPGPNTFTTPGKPHPSTERATSATPAPKTELNMEIRRNIYDQKGKEVTPKDDSEKQTNGEAGTTNGATEDSGVKAMEDAAKEPKKTFNCYSCGIDCTRCRFHYSKNADASKPDAAKEIKYDLCPNCYFQSRMPSAHRSSDFVKLEEPDYTTIPDKDAPWTDSETLLLLEGLEMYDENWSQVSDHVGTRTREECVLKFLQLEIQDQYVEDDIDRVAVSGKGALVRDSISQLENPVMSVLSFLAQMADPAVVTAATGRSVEVIRKELQTALEKNAKDTEASAAEEQEVKNEDSMEVDAADGEVAPRTNAPPKPATDLATVGLATAGARSSALASHEERDLTRIVGAAVNLTLQKWELKLAQFNEIEAIVQSERKDLERGRQQLFLDRLAFRKRMQDMEDTFRNASQKPPEEGMRMMSEVMGAASGKRFGFQPSNGMTNGVTPLGGEGGEMKTFEI